MSKAKHPSELPTPDRLRELFQLDPDTGVLTSRVRRFTVKPGDRIGYVNSRGYLIARVEGSNLTLHRVIFAMVNSVWPDEVDHINLVRTDNRPCNLRAATRSENCRNTTVREGTVSGVKNVRWSKQHKRWAVACQVNGVRKHLGNFVELEVAKAVAQAFRAKHHGSFARHE
jgi:signal peptidase I